MSSTQYLIDASTRHQVFLQRYGGSEARKAIGYLNGLRRNINARLAQEPTIFQRDRLLVVLEDITALIDEMMVRLTGATIYDSNQLAIAEAHFSSQLYSRASTTDFTTPSDVALIAGLEAAPMAAPAGMATMTIDDALKQFGASKSAQISQLITDGVTLGQTTPEISRGVSNLINTQTRRQIDALVRTIANHTSSVARGLTYADNDELLEGYQWVATLDGRTTMICGSRDGKIYPIYSTVKPPAHWNCVLGDTLITSAIGISTVFKRVFKGEVITINTVSGNKLTVTPNHPILTSEGWRAAKLLSIGDKCFNQSLCKGVGSVDSDNNSGFKTAEDIFESFGGSSGVVSSEMEVSAPDFHGDGVDDEIAEISSTSDLSAVFDAGIIEKVSNSVFSWRNMPFIDSAIHRFSIFAFLVKTSSSASCRNVGFFGKALSFLRSCSVHSSLLLGRSISQSDAAFSEDSLNGSWTDTEGLCDSPDSYAGGVFLDDIISIEVSDFSGHVYNLQTLDHCYSANGIITHNCRSTTIPIVKDAFNIGSKLTGSRPSIGADGVEIVSSRTTYGGWLRTQPTEFIDEALGVERSRLFRAGSLDIGKFVDPTGRVYTLSQLEDMNPFAFQEF